MVTLPLPLPRVGAAVPVVAGTAALMAATAFLSPPLLTPLIAALLALGSLLLTWRHLTAAWVVWILAAGLSPEMAITDLIGPEAFQPTIAAIKGGEIGLDAATFILGPLAMTAEASFIYGIAVGAAMWLVVGVLILATHGELSPKPLRTRLV